MNVMIDNVVSEFLGHLKKFYKVDRSSRNRRYLDYLQEVVPMAAVRQEPEGTLEIVLNLAGNVLTRFGGGIAKILFGDVDPKTAYEQCIEGEC